MGIDHRKYLGCKVLLGNGFLISRSLSVMGPKNISLSGSRKHSISDEVSDSCIS